jgi:phage replication-related protein YjqB (UPF0714/DUF867 family)
MKDKYDNFAELHAGEGAKAYRLVALARGSEVAVIAPHGGGIERGTSELARAIAGAELSLYLFEGRLSKGNKETLHITSHKFDEPEGVAIVASSVKALAIHGEASKQAAVVYLGGRDKELGAFLRQHLEGAGFTVTTHADARLQGVDPNNICNRGRSGLGVQLELSEALRLQFFPSLDAKGRAAPRKRFYEFVQAVRAALGLPNQA